MKVQRTETGRQTFREDTAIEVALLVSCDGQRMFLNNKLTTFVDSAVKNVAVITNYLPDSEVTCAEMSTSQQIFSFRDKISSDDI